MLCISLLLPLLFLWCRTYTQHACTHQGQGVAGVIAVSRLLFQSQEAEAAREAEVARGVEMEGDVAAALRSRNDTEDGGGVEGEDSGVVAISIDSDEEDEKGAGEERGESIRGQRGRGEMARAMGMVVERTEGRSGLQALNMCGETSPSPFLFACTFMVRPSRFHFSPTLSCVMCPYLPLLAGATLTTHTALLLSGALKANKCVSNLMLYGHKGGLPATVALAAMLQENR
jgi:hypothetical protein